MSASIKICAALFASAPALAQLPYDGVTLFQPNNSTSARLIDNDGSVVHTWPGTARPGLSVYLLEDGNLLRTRRLVNGTGGSGGGVEEVEWDGTVVWSFDYANADHLQHHDIEMLPNGNILMIAWEYLTRQDAIAAGRNPALIQGQAFAPDHIIEVRPTGPTSGEIVWEWHVWDHLVQDFDPAVTNYGVVADHPELIDVNYPPDPVNTDWNHSNGIDYNADLDQIILSARSNSEFWVIDHSTTTAEAAGHTGGHSGKGGDLLYRWGNPAAYDAGTVQDQQLFSQHNAHWIPEGLPGAGNILVFNNGLGRPAGTYSTVDEIVPPVDAQGNYALTPGGAYGPAQPVWIYTAPIPTSFFSSNVSGAQRLPNGNTLICEGAPGRFFEVTSASQTVWTHIHGQGVFRAERYSYSQLPVGIRYCGPAADNSTGFPALIAATGTAVAGEPLTLWASQLPPNQFGYFLASMQQGLFSPPGSDGTICLSGNIGRFSDPSQVANSGTAGVISLTVDTNDIPVNPPVAVQAGQTWYFQAWYRDAGNTNNFSEGISVTF
ncbi:MAG: arylsulfotransferase (ASST) [bacterium]|nr:arylsulfotransferase (ASST) [bacterium]